MPHDQQALRGDQAFVFSAGSRHVWELREQTGKERRGFLPQPRIPEHPSDRKTTFKAFPTPTAPPPAPPRPASSCESRANGADLRLGVGEVATTPCPRPTLWGSLWAHSHNWDFNDELFSFLFILTTNCFQN